MTADKTLVTNWSEIQKKKKKKEKSIYKVFTLSFQLNYKL